MNAREIAEGHGFTTRQGVRFLLVASHKSAQRIGGHIERKAGCVGEPFALDTLGLSPYTHS